WHVTATDPVDLPVYYQSRFVTDSTEDVETLLRRLRPLTTDKLATAGAATRASAAKPGYYLDYEKAGAAFDVQGALRQPNAAQAGLETDPALTTRMTATLQQVIAGEADSEDVNGPDPL